jgi:hypothetical protein
MSNLIQIKRSLTSAIPGSLANGELAYTAAGDIFYVGSPNGSVVAIGGARTPGILTANQALVANATGFLNEIRVANAALNKIYANGAFGSIGQVLTSDASGNVYWNTQLPSVVGTNTQIQFNDSGSLGADSGLTFDKNTDTLTVSNAVSTAYITATNGSRNITTNYNSVSGAVGVATDLTVGASGVGGNVVANNILTSTVNATSFQVGSNFVANTTRLVIGSSVGVSANGSVGNDGDSLISNGSSVYWATRVSSVSTGDGLSGGLISTTGTIAVQANDGIIANGAGLFVRAGTGVTVNATGVHIGQAVGTTNDVTFRALSTTGNVALGDSSSDTVSLNGVVNTAIIPQVDLVYNIGSAAERWANVFTGVLYSNTGIFAGNVRVDGDLSVLGTTFTVSSNNLIVGDSMIQLAANNTTSDLLDIGFHGNYNNDGGIHEHTGLFRDATDGIYKLFFGVQDTPTNTVNTAGVGYSIATLQAYLNSGALTTNATSVGIAANSTVSVSITANTLTLSTALAGTSGGTGRSTTTSQSLLVGNTTNGYDTLALGTSGHVLQSNGTAIIYATLDGGSF